VVSSLEVFSSKPDINLFPACVLHDSPTSSSLIYHPNTILERSLDSVVGIATGYGLDAVGSRIFSSPRRPDRLWGPLNLLSSEYRG
jgi:hypothetical protein